MKILASVNVDRDSSTTYLHPKLVTPEVGDVLVRTKGWRTLRQPEDDAAELIEVTSDNVDALRTDQCFRLARDGEAALEVDELELCQRGRWYVAVWGDPNNVPDEGAMVFLATAATPGTMKAFPLLGMDFPVEQDPSHLED